jgi:hypothetical protein
VFAFHEELQSGGTQETDCFGIVIGAILTGDEVLVVVNALYNLVWLKLCLV